MGVYVDDMRTTYDNLSSCRLRFVLPHPHCMPAAAQTTTLSCPQYSHATFSLHGHNRTSSGVVRNTEGNSDVPSRRAEAMKSVRLAAASRPTCSALKLSMSGARPISIKLFNMPYTSFRRVKEYSTARSFPRICATTWKSRHNVSRARSRLAISPRQTYEQG